MAKKKKDDEPKPRDEDLEIVEPLDDPTDELVAADDVAEDVVAVDGVASEEVVEPLVEAAFDDDLLIAEDAAADEAPSVDVEMPSLDVEMPSGVSKALDVADVADVDALDVPDDEPKPEAPAENLLDADGFELGDAEGDGGEAKGGFGLDEPGADDEGELVGAISAAADEPPAPQGPRVLPTEPSKPRAHWLTYVLIGLNVIAAGTFGYFLLMSIEKRQDYLYAILLHDLRMIGLPNAEEEHAPVAARGTLPRHALTGEMLKKVAQSRGVAIGDPVIDVDEKIAAHLKPSQLDDTILKDHFGAQFLAGKTVRTIEDEIVRVKGEVLADIKKAAEDSWAVLPGDDKAKRSKVERLVLTLVADVHQAKAVHELIQAAQGKALQDIYLEAVQRRMAFDFLVPLELFRPGDPKKSFVAKIGDLDGLKRDDLEKLYLENPEYVAKHGKIERLKLDDVLARVTERLEATIDPKHRPLVHLGDYYKIEDPEQRLLNELSKERETVEKRLTVAFALTSLAHVKKPDGELLYPALLERIPLVVGQYDFTLACQLFPRGLRAMNDRIVALLVADRQGYAVRDKDGNDLWVKGFPNKYEDDLQTIRFVQQAIKKAQLRLSELEGQKAGFDKVLATRVEQRQDVLDRIAKARAQTAKDMDEVRMLMNELFEYQVILSTSEQQLGALMEGIYLRQLKKKGATP